jgi:hypothetical protein
MATHIDSVAGSNIPKVSKAEFYKNCQIGDLVFCWGQELLSRGIEAVAGGPSHVLTIWVPSWLKQWMTVEALAEKNVSVNLFSGYTDDYDGDIVLCRRPALTQAEICEELNIKIAHVGENYDYIEEASIAIRKIKMFSKLPDIKPKNELYCSALVQLGGLNTIPFKTYDSDWNTPEQDFIDPSVETICCLLKGSK